MPRYTSGTAASARRGDDWDDHDRAGSNAGAGAGSNRARTLYGGETSLANTQSRPLVVTAAACADPRSQIPDHDCEKTSRIKVRAQPNPLSAARRATSIVDLGPLQVKEASFLPR